jgi:hypothetical protein
MAVQTIVETDFQDILKALGWRIGQRGNDVHTIITLVPWPIQH